MIRQAYYRNRYLKVLFLFLAFGGILLLSSFADVGYKRSKDGNTQLRVIGQFTIPIREISGLTLTKDVHEETAKLYAVGDRYAKVAYLNLNLENFALGPIGVLDLTNAILDRFSVCQSREILQCKRQSDLLTSQWEAINVDTKGQIYLLNEQLASIFSFNPEGTRLDTVINLSSFHLATHKLRLRTSRHKKNALGEGMLLLRNGHILVIKEREKASVIEFGNVGEQAMGYQKQKMANQNPSGRDFPAKDFTGRLSLSPLKAWRLPAELSGCDLSELSSDDEGSLYLLSQQCGWIMRAGDLDLESRRISIDKLWLLPSELKFAEAFVVLGDGRFIVSEDRKSTKKPNTFFLGEYDRR